MGKIAITSLGNSHDSKFDLRFGRAEWFCVIDSETCEKQFIENNNSNAPNGAGIKAAELMATLGVKRVISGDFGPKAKDLLERLKIQMVIIKDDGLKIGELIRKMDLD